MLLSAVYLDIGFPLFFFRIPTYTLINTARTVPFGGILIILGVRPFSQIAPSIVQPTPIDVIYRGISSFV